MKETSFEKTIDLIRRRETTKILADVQSPLHIPSEVEEVGNARVRAAVAAAGWAPFHFARQADGLAEPWRVTILWQTACRQLAAAFHQWFADVKPGNKIPSMLSACGALVLITELPNTSEEIPDPVKLEQVNREHTLAVGAMVQTLLLALTAADMPTYWSSGGQLGSSSCFQRLGISPGERLAAAVFVGYPVESYHQCERLPGGNRQKRAPASKWVREHVTLIDE